jgi:hypothetical protein
VILQWTGRVVFIAEAKMHMEFKKKIDYKESGKSERPEDNTKWVYRK